jgi:hypothetical protein
VQSKRLHLQSLWTEFLVRVGATRWSIGEIVANNLSKAAWSWGCVSAIDSKGRTIWIVDAHRDGKRFIVRTDEKLTTFLEMEAAIRGNR